MTDDDENITDTRAAARAMARVLHAARTGGDVAAAAESMPGGTAGARELLLRHSVAAHKAALDNVTEACAMAVAAFALRDADANEADANEGAEQ